MTKTVNCGVCKFWNAWTAAPQFGVCHNPAVYSWVRGDSFEPPKEFACNEFAPLSVLGLKIEIDDTVSTWEFKTND